MPNVLPYSLLFGETLDGPFNYLRSIAILSTGNSLGVHNNLDFHLIGLWTNLFVGMRLRLNKIFVNKKLKLILIKIFKQALLTDITSVCTILKKMEISNLLIMTEKS
jgi:hypothetical protein